MSEQRKLYCIHGIYPEHCGACQGQLIDSLRERIAELEKVAEAAAKKHHNKNDIEYMNACYELEEPLRAAGYLKEGE